MKNPSWLKEIDHTADAGIVVRAGTEKALFARAAWGMFSLLTDMAKVRPVEALDLTVEAEDREALMVRWLAELNYQHNALCRLFCRFEIAGYGPCRLTARAYGEPLDRTRHVIYGEIKAVTFHALKIWKEQRLWRARIIFDL